MRFVYILFFLLGMYVYTLIPKDAVPGETPNVVPIAHAAYYDEAGNNCTIYIFNPQQYATCQKK